MLLRRGRIEPDGSRSILGGQKDISVESHTCSGSSSTSQTLTAHSMVLWADTQHVHGAQSGYEPISSIPPWRSTQNFTEEANAHNHGNLLAEQHVDWREQGRNASNFHQAGFEKNAAQESERAARDEVHVAVALATEMFRAKVLARMGALEQRPEQSWTSHSVMLLDEYKCRRRRTANREKKLAQ